MQGGAGVCRGIVCVRNAQWERQSVCFVFGGGGLMLVGAVRMVLGSRVVRAAAGRLLLLLCGRHRLTATATALPYTCWCISCAYAAAFTHAAYYAHAHMLLHSET
mgnify:CR=1 FL=1